MPGARPPRGGTPLELAGVLFYHGHEPVPAPVRVVHHPRPRRVVRALGALGACWGIGIVGVFIPLLHFILVPAMLIAGPVLAWRRLHEGVTVLDASGACPACGREQVFVVKDRWKEALPVRCDGCGRAIEVRVDIGGLEPAGG